MSDNYLKYENKRLKEQVKLFHDRWQEARLRLDSQTELQEKISKLETENMLLKMALSQSRERCQDLQDIELISDADILAIYKAAHKE